MLFNKRSEDHSGKANLVESLGQEAWGVLYEIDDSDLETLDRTERGYDRVTVRVCKADGTIVEAMAYVSKNVTDDPRAYKWYKDLVISGARENNLPAHYISYLERLPSKPNAEAEE